MTENQKQYLISVKNVHFFYQNGYFTKKIYYFRWKTRCFNKILKILWLSKIMIFCGNFTFPKIFFPVRISIFWWKFNFKGSKEIIFRVGHVTVGLHMFHNVNFWLDLKIKSKNIRIFQIVDSNSKTEKTLKFVFQNIKKWTCEFSSADFLKNGKFWQKINLEHLKVKFQTRNNLWSMKKYNRNFVNIREWYLRGNFTSDKSVPARLRAW